MLLSVIIFQHEFCQQKFHQHEPVEQQSIIQPLQLVEQLQHSFE